MRRESISLAILSALALLPGCARSLHQEPVAPPVRIEVFVVTADSARQAVQYVRRQAPLSIDSPDPDVVARTLAASSGTPSLLHSTSWRREKDGAIVLTYLAYCEPAQFHPPEPVQIPWKALAAPPPTDPLHPRPPEIRDSDVLTHGLRHLSFLVRHAQDGRLAAALSSESQTFFRAMCGQLAGRLESAREAEECAATSGRRTDAPGSGR